MKRRALGLVCATGLLTGCGFQGVASLPLPGAVGTGDDTYQVVVEFQDVLDLVPYSSVKVQDATVGHVVDVRLADGHAEVVVQIEDGVRLPANAVGRVAETSLLGEKYVSLDRPRDEPSRGELSDGDVVPLARTSTGATVEELLASLSLVVNGGGLDKVRTITTELNNALGGREDEVRSALEQLDVLIAGLDEQKADIVRALEGIERVSATFAAQQELLVDAVQQLPAALEVLVEQRKSLTAMLVALDRLGVVGTRVIVASREDLLANLRSLQPALTQLAKAAEDIPKSLDISPLYPFAKGTPNVFHGDFGNIWLTLDFDPASLASNFPPGSVLPPGVPIPPAVPGLPSVPGLPKPGLPAVPQLPSTRTDAASDIAELLLGGSW